MIEIFNDQVTVLERGVHSNLKIAPMCSDGDTFGWWYCNSTLKEGLIMQRLKI
jgi:hypothetical protein